MNLFLHIYFIIILFKMSTQFEAESSPCIILNQDSPRVDQPTLNIPLKQHQLALIHKCREFEKSSIDSYNIDGLNIKTKMGIIGDIVGSGKTLSILGLIETENNVKTTIPKYYSNQFISYIDSSQLNYNNFSNDKKYLSNTNVIVVPHNIYKQWSSTIETHTNLKYIGIYNKKSYEKFNEELIKEDFDYDIILISSTKYKDISSILYNYAFSRVIIDEADSIKITGHKVNYNFIWLVTSTYDILCNPNGTRKYANENGELSSWYDPSRGHINYVYFRGVQCVLIKLIMNSFNTIENKVKKQLIIKNDDEFIKNAFNLQDYIVNILKSNNPLVVNILGTFASQEIMNHINGGDMEGAIEKLNCKKISEKFLIEAVTKDFEDKLHNKKIELEMKSKMTYSSDNAKKESLDKIKGKIYEIESKIDGIKSKLNDNNVCSICYDEIDNKAITMCCNTKFCLTCISTWLHLNDKCPFCRAKISNNNLCVITDNIPEKKISNLSTKMQNLKKLIETKKDEPGFKMLIFSDYYNTFKDIVEFIETTNINYRRVLGTTATINKIVNNYKQPNSNLESIQILLLNADYCASGINLENTSDIVIYHSMSEAKTKQIIGRGQRPGRTSVLNVWKLCYENEMSN